MPLARMLRTPINCSLRLALPCLTVTLPPTRAAAICVGVGCARPRTVSWARASARAIWALRRLIGPVDEVKETRPAAPALPAGVLPPGAIRVTGVLLQSPSTRLAALASDPAQAPKSAAEARVARALPEAANAGCIGAVAAAAKDAATIMATAAASGRSCGR